MSFITDSEFQNILGASWDQLCFTAYDGYRQFGRGLVGVMKSGDELKAVFTHPAEGHITEPADLDLINRYNPEEEIVVQYRSAPGKSRTLILQVADKNSPAEIWNKFNLEGFLK